MQKGSLPGFLSAGVLPKRQPQLLLQPQLYLPGGVQVVWKAYKCIAAQLLILIRLQQELHTHTYSDQSRQQADRKEAASGK